MCLNGFLKAGQPRHRWFAKVCGKSLAQKSILIDLQVIPFHLLLTPAALRHTYIRLPHFFLYWFFLQDFQSQFLISDYICLDFLSKFIFIWL